MVQKRPIIQYSAMGLLLLCVMANPLEQVSAYLKWIDELICLAACIIAAGGITKLDITDKTVRRNLLVVAPFLLYMFMQLLGSLIFHYQPWGAVITDAFTNAKFWLTLWACYLFGGKLPAHDVDRGLLNGAKAISLLLFLLFLLERCGLVFSGGGMTDNRWNIPSIRLFYTHPTYLAAAVGLLLAVLLFQWNHWNVPYAVMDLIMLVFTFRSKAYGSAAVFLGLLMLTVVWKWRVRIWHLLLAGPALIVLAWEKIEFYFIKLGGRSARSVMMNTSMQVLKDYFPLGTGFATFGSNQATVHYSPLYFQYGFAEGFGVGKELSYETRLFLDDTFWPIVFAQSGFIGTCAFLAMLFLLIRKAWKIYDISPKYYAAALFMIAYMLISSTSEPAFNNPIGVPFAMLLGYCFAQSDKMKREEGITT